MIVIDHSSPVPPFEQLRGQLAAQIHEGEVRREDRLPTVRRMAHDLGISPNTVARAYRELEEAGLVDTRGRNGTVVIGPRMHPTNSLEQAADTFVAEVLALNADPDQAIRLVEQRLRLSTRR